MESFSQEQLQLPNFDRRYSVPGLSPTVLFFDQFSKDGFYQGGVDPASFYQQPGFDDDQLYHTASQVIALPSEGFSLPTTPLVPGMNLVEADLAEQHSSGQMSPPISPQKKLLSFIDPNNIKKNNRFKVKDDQLSMLLAVFEKNPFPSVHLRKKIAERLGLDQKQVQFFFQNRRATLKMNGIHVLKPKVNGSISLKPGMVPVSRNSHYFFVEQSSAVPALAVELEV
ncbi:hypothetical protein BC830DRAFT_541305 [Chytriomyces sp. MP71]|nr:hypothetical protein BC830DRAFT_541305 [Chytriomyces sp. MP71]